ncbi:helix-turn-helix domain-containing protein [Candidatus Micrarchaeota archaeon]|nr:helix-turn-helix domain-containing protein [Candidatus Micrarchaeota archaeon]
MRKNQLKGGWKYSKKKSKYGRPSSLTRNQIKELFHIYYSRPFSIRKLAKIFSVSKTTIWQKIKKHNNLPRKRAAP